MKRSEHSAVQSKCPLWVKSRHLQRKKACPLYPQKRTSLRRTWLSGDAKTANGPNPPFGHVADLIARHRRKIITKEKLPYDGRRAGFCHLRGHFFKKKLWLSSVES